MTSSESLKPLSEPVRTRLRSTQLLTSLPQVVSELVQNSLDASASNIEIGVDCQEWECWVKDDGHGIARNGLDALSKSLEAGRYHTSKAYDLSSLTEISTFGFRGEALASAADVSCLEISSRTSISRQTWSVITKNGRSLYNGSAARWRMEQSGTVVHLRDIFYNLPIRRSSHPRPSKTMDIICRGIETLALVFPGVSFTVSTIRQPSESGPRTSRVLHIPKTSSILSTFRHINGKSLVDKVDEVAVSSGVMKLEGFIGLKGSRTKAHQYIYINRHPLTQSHQLHRNIDDAFSNSSFSNRVLCADTINPRQHPQRSPSKLDRKPIFVLSLTIPSKDIDTCLEPGKSLIHVSNEDVVTAFFESVVHEFLLRHGFLVSGEARTTSQKRRRINTEEYSPRDTSDTLALRRSNTLSSTGSVLPIACERDTASNVPPLDVSPGDDNNDEHELVWIDPNSGTTFLVDKRTGHSRPHIPLSLESGEESAQAISSTRRTIAFAQPGDRVGEPPQWILDALESNSAYLVSELPIPSISQQPPNILSLPFERLSLATCATHSSDCVDSSSSSVFDQPSTWSLQKDDLTRMKVINQLDRKFILCTVDPIRASDDSNQASDIPARILVLVDQHAASERVRVEGFLKTLCHNYFDLESIEKHSGANRIELDPPRPIILSRKEASILRGSRSGLGRWCFDLSWPEPKSRDQSVDQNTHEQVLVHSVPHVVGDKLLAGDELRKFLKEYVTELETDDVPPALGAEMHGDHLTWHKALRWCPKGLLGLVNSRACRGAIMFNDSLSIEQCERLMTQLAETAFPFQCAHGRPSLVPLTRTSECPLGQGRQRDVDWGRSGSMLASLGEESSGNVGWIEEATNL